MNSNINTKGNKLGSETRPINVESLPENKAESKSPPSKKSWKTKAKLPCKETDTFWHGALSSPPPPAFIPGVILLLRKGLVKAHDRGLIRSAALCDLRAVFTHRQPWDAGWGCGYRNFMMACASLMNQDLQPLYFPLLDSPLSPSIRNLQQWIEDTWSDGFDGEGQAQLKELAGTRKWIGTSDLWVAFAYRGIPAQLVDFEMKDDSKAFLKWIVEYFTPTELRQPTNFFQPAKISPVIITEKMPLILQHDGHSQTIVGYEIDKKGEVNLYCFDPGKPPPPEIRNEAIAMFNESRSATGPSSASDDEIQFIGLKRKRVESVDESFNPNGLQPNDSASNSKPTTKPPSKKGKSFFNQDKPPDLTAVLSRFRVGGKTLKKSRYQILYFPMTAPLTEQERLQRRVVISRKIQL